MVERIRLLRQDIQDAEVSPQRTLLEPSKPLSEKLVSSIKLFTTPLTDLARKVKLRGSRRFGRGRGSRCSICQGKHFVNSQCSGSSMQLKVV